MAQALERSTGRSSFGGFSPLRFGVLRGGPWKHTTARACRSALDLEGLGTEIPEGKLHSLLQSNLEQGCFPQSDLEPGRYRQMDRQASGRDDPPTDSASAYREEEPRHGHACGNVDSVYRLLDDEKEGQGNPSSVLIRQRL